MATAILHAPKSARAGEVIEVRATIAHPMESGYRAGNDGQTAPRDIIRRLECRWAGELVFAADLHPALAANPYMAFHALAIASGPLTVRWWGDGGFDHSETVQIEVV